MKELRKQGELHYMGAINSFIFEAMSDPFLTDELPRHLRHLQEDSQPLWGEMTPVQMVDHLYTGLLLGQIPDDFPIHTSEDKIPVYQSFLMSEKPLPRHAVRPEGFDSHKPGDSPTLEAAIDRLLDEVPSFLRALDQTGYRMVHRDFGVLDPKMALTLNRKHIRHHLAQFGLIER